MKKAKIITGLDIGSSKVAAASAEIRQDGDFNVLAQVTVPSKGISRGVPVDMDQAIYSVSKALGRLREKTGMKPGGIYVNISGDSLKGSRSRGMIPLSVRGREVTAPDMARCVNAASTINLPFDREIIHRIVNSFSVDERQWIKNPAGLSASRIHCEVFIVSAGTNQIQDIYKIVNSAGSDIQEIIYTGIADGAAILDKGDRQSSVILADIGSSLTELSIFSGGALCDLETVPVGADDIKGEFAESAEFSSIAFRISSRAQGYTASHEKISSVIVTGGFSFRDGVVEALEELIPFRVKMGAVRDIRGDISAIEAVRAATAIGLCKYAREKLTKKAREEGSPIRRLSTKVVDIFNNYF